ncbi:MAG: LysR family transcriptional regulator [Eggerthellaceae bacterium]|nr:LysR family transcriptional regulator [Eggerthellaceae bacterium]
MKKLNKLNAEVRLSITNKGTDGNSVFGPGIAALCSGVRELGSLNAAAKSMGMAYSKAWRIIKDTEETLEVQLLDRDGAHGSQLTEEGSKLLDVYSALQEKLSKEAMELYKELS